ncbi:hypothetical protein GUITHDRAFT_156205 [Guillardia theta CCMP2712]|uniref:RWP-RK domain-containing protein n=1 Tax=Guillardia theta (strain CCMP2712) TaxID=905079 RepID=L1I9J5_GUITC|nr:hypothetical protein GUITHDRAFT_156205 [Guillardia theta CCMP2712]EKX32916.1 hypothetical protein GUITHDRAFT_156205 [Guillardia theta CCMP2712]|mmetsp:Transcript_26969/g.88180  ORF Transcript_26969/g.88180 Transcript_26969/m.88180 type:complete len:191 (-) Transcript_26969:290-862(-)|eukprot:XP_005819896.1 hypothetical protein GUITHDRAFT_156205 [Guillardia theta CCMP2712]
MLAPRVARVFPRRRRNEREIDSNRREEIVLTAADITNMFYMRQAEAAESLGISLTALKNACKQVGIEHWPYARSTASRIQKSNLMMSNNQHGGVDAPNMPAERSHYADVINGSASVATRALSSFPDAAAISNVTQHCWSAGSVSIGEVPRKRKASAEDWETTWFYPSGRQVSENDLACLLSESLVHVIEG